MFLTASNLIFFIIFLESLISTCNAQEGQETPFLYLINQDSCNQDFGPLMSVRASWILVLTGSEADHESCPEAFRVPGLNVFEARNFLFQQAKQLGWLHRAKYVVMVDGSAILHDDSEADEYQNIWHDFEESLVISCPAIGFPRMKGLPAIESLDVQPVPYIPQMVVAYHVEAAELLLPYTRPFNRNPDSELFDDIQAVVSSLTFHPTVVQYNRFIATTNDGSWNFAARQTPLHPSCEGLLWSLSALQSLDDLLTVGTGCISATAATSRHTTSAPTAGATSAPTANLHSGTHSTLTSHPTAPLSHAQHGSPLRRLLQPYAAEDGYYAAAGASARLEPIRYFLLQRRAAAAAVQLALTCGADRVCLPPHGSEAGGDSARDRAGVNSAAGVGSDRVGGWEAEMAVEYQQRLLLWLHEATWDVLGLADTARTDTDKVGDGAAGSGLSDATRADARAEGAAGNGQPTRIQVARAGEHVPPAEAPPLGGHGGEVYTREFLYLVHESRGTCRDVTHLMTAGSRVVRLYVRGENEGGRVAEACQGAVMRNRWPGVAAARNILLEEATRRFPNERFRYYVFVDGGVALARARDCLPQIRSGDAADTDDTDDIEHSGGPLGNTHAREGQGAARPTVLGSEGEEGAWRVFERFLLRWEPAVGFPRIGSAEKGAGDGVCKDVGLAGHVQGAGLVIGQAVVAFHAEAAAVLLPYRFDEIGDDRFDQATARGWRYSWHDAAQDVLCAYLFPEHTLQFNTFVATFSSPSQAGSPPRAAAPAVIAAKGSAAAKGGSDVETSGGEEMEGHAVATDDGGTLQADPQQEIEGLAAASSEGEEMQSASETKARPASSSGAQSDRGGNTGPPSAMYTEGTGSGAEDDISHHSTSKGQWNGRDNTENPPPPFSFDHREEEGDTGSGSGMDGSFVRRRQRGWTWAVNWLSPAFRSLDRFMRLPLVSIDDCELSAVGGAGAECFPPRRGVARRRADDRTLPGGVTRRSYLATAAAALDFCHDYFRINRQSGASPWSAELNRLRRVAGCAGGGNRRSDVDENGGAAHTGAADGVKADARQPNYAHRRDDSAIGGSEVEMFVVRGIQQLQQQLQPQVTDGADSSSGETVQAEDAVDGNAAFYPRKDIGRQGSTRKAGLERRLRRFKSIVEGLMAVASFRHAAVDSAGGEDDTCKVVKPMHTAHDDSKSENLRQAAVTAATSEAATAAERVIAARRRTHATVWRRFRIYSAEVCRVCAARAEECGCAAGDHNPTFRLLALFIRRTLAAQWPLLSAPPSSSGEHYADERIMEKGSPHAAAEDGNNASEEADKSTGSDGNSGEGSEEWLWPERDAGGMRRVKWVIAKLSGGVGNQNIQLVAAMLVAIVTQRGLAVDLHSRSAEGLPGGHDFEFDSVLGQLPEMGELQRAGAARHMHEMLTKVETLQSMLCGHLTQELREYDAIYIQLGQSPHLLLGNHFVGPTLRQVFHGRPYFFLSRFFWMGEAQRTGLFANFVTLPAPQPWDGKRTIAEFSRLVRSSRGGERGRAIRIVGVHARIFATRPFEYFDHTYEDDNATGTVDWSRPPFCTGDSKGLKEFSLCVRSLVSDTGNATSSTKEDAQTAQASESHVSRAATAAHPDGRRGNAYAGAAAAGGTAADEAEHVILWSTDNDDLAAELLRDMLALPGRVHIVRIAFGGSSDRFDQAPEAGMLDVLFLQEADDLIGTTSSTFSFAVHARALIRPYYPSFRTFRSLPCGQPAGTEAGMLFRGLTHDQCERRGPNDWDSHLHCRRLRRDCLQSVMDSLTLGLCFQDLCNVGGSCSSPDAAAGGQSGADPGWWMVGQQRDSEFKFKLTGEGEATGALADASEDAGAADSAVGASTEWAEEFLLDLDHAKFTAIWQARFGRVLTTGYPYPKLTPCPSKIYGTA